MTSRLFFLCASGSGRALLAASLLQSQARRRFDIWCSPPPDTRAHALIAYLLQEQGLPPLAPDHLIPPTFGLRWDEGIILCSGLAAT